MLTMLLWMMAATASSQPSTEIIRDPVVLSFCRSLVRKAMTERFREQGAFVVRTIEGTFYFVMWPPGDESDMLRWYGRFPDGTLAIVHTHPPWLQTASQIDMRAARSAGIPVYVITPSAISKTTGESSEVVMKGDWISARTQE
jgi:proteasome lid subunit RPN8/RPN11